MIKPAAAGPQTGPRGPQTGPKTSPKTGPKTGPQTGPKTGPQTTGQAALTTITVAMRRDIAPTFKQLSIHRDHVPALSALYPGLPAVPAMELKYNPKMHALAAFNCTSYTWTVVSSTGVQTQCPPGSHAVLSKGCKIAFIRRKLQMDILEVK